MKTDPICHMQVDESTALSATVDGEQYYFCSEHCRKKFVAEHSTTQSSALVPTLHTLELPTLGVVTQEPVHDCCSGQGGEAGGDGKDSGR